MPDIEFHGISKYYGPLIKAVDNLNFTIYDGEYLSLLGPSGCGKTTTLRLLAGLILPTEGKILWGGKSIEQKGPDERDLGYVFQQFAIFPHLSVYDNIAFGPRVKGFSTKDEEEFTERYIRLVGLTEKVNYYPKELDAADLQRIGIARVLATGANTLLLDEPMGALDFKIREKFQDELVRIVKDLGLTAIHVTHDQSEAMAISDRIGVMKKGEMIQLGSPEDLLFDPSQIFTAHFIGESDFFEGVVVKKDENEIYVELLGDELLIIPKSIPSIIPGSRVVIGVRREFPKILHEKPDVDTNLLVGEIISDRFVGDKWRTRLKLDYGRYIEVKRLPSERPLNTNGKSWIQLPQHGIFVFSFPQEGLREALNVT